ncbi:MAG TPA: hypothetical protein VEV84_09580 [Pyrinomonadaceae bacterium]|nr:hypothetical protein [Pyrinomonadaceae bacterium]
MTRRDEQHTADEQLTDEQKRENVIRLAFNGDRKRFEEFCRVLERHTPANTAAVLGGSSITGHSYKEGASFDAEGPMTSDLDITLVGNEILNLFSLEGFWVPGIHTHPVKEGDDDIAAPELKKLRHHLQAIAFGRPVTIQASRDFYYTIREKWLGQPYLTLVGKLSDE